MRFDYLFVIILTENILTDNFFITFISWVVHVFEQNELGLMVVSVCNNINIFYFMSLKIYVEK